MKFMMIVKATKESEAGVMPPEELLGAMAKYNEELIKAGVLLDGAGLKPSSYGFRVQYSGGQKSIVDGPFAETKEMIAGFWVIQVKSRAEAVEWAKRIPHPHPSIDTYVEVRQFFELEDFGESPAAEHHRELEKEMSKQRQ